MKRILQPLDRQIHDGLCDKEAADFVELSEVVLGSFNGNPAHLVRFGNDAQRANGSESETPRGSSHREIVGQQQRHRKLRTEQEALPLS